MCLGRLDVGPNIGLNQYNSWSSCAVCLFLYNFIFSILPSVLFLVIFLSHCIAIGCVEGVRIGKNRSYCAPNL